MPDRVIATPAAIDLIRRLRRQHGPLMFHQSNGCYDCGVQFQYWAHTQLIIDVVPGRGASFSLEIPEGVRFLTRSRLFSDDETSAQELAGPPPMGPAASL
jgi:uncharacterized protein (DUF779 family)